MIADLSPLGTSAIAALINVACVLAIGPLLDGIMRKVTARIQSRKGPPLVQSYLDLLKLLGKEDIQSGEVPAVQRAAATVALASVLLAACLTPMGFGAPLARYADGIVLLYVLTLCGLATALAGLAAGSTYSVIGVSREMMAMMLLEPLFAVAVVAGALRIPSLNLNDLLSGSVYSGGAPWSGLALLVVMILAFQAYAQRQPFDTTEAETEIMDGPLVEYSGPKLAMLKWAGMSRLVVYGSLFIGLFVPWGSGLAAYYAWPLHWAKLLVLVLIVCVTATVHARVRMDQALSRYAGLLSVSLLALVLAAAGY